MFGRTRHRRSLLHGAKVHYRAGDEATVDALARLHEQSLRLLRDEFYLLPPEGMPIYIVRSWPALVLSPLSAIGRLTTLFFWPLHWYTYSFCRCWRDIYAWLHMPTPAQAYLCVRALDTLPPGPPPHVRPRWERQPDRVVTREQVWSKEICRGLALAACSDRLPIWLRIGIQQFVSGQIVIRFPPPLEIQGIAKWIGHDPQSFDLRDLSQTHVEKQEELAACFGEWQYWAVNWLKQCRPAELAAILSTPIPPHEVQNELALRLGFPPDRFWEYLRHHVETDYDRQAAENAGDNTPGVELFRRAAERAMSAAPMTRIPLEVVDEGAAPPQPPVAGERAEVGSPPVVGLPEVPGASAAEAVADSAAGDPSPCSEVDTNPYAAPASMPTSKVQRVRISPMSSVWKYGALIAAVVGVTSSLSWTGDRNWLFGVIERDTVMAAVIGAVGAVWIWQLLFVAGRVTYDIASGRRNRIP